MWLLHFFYLGKCQRRAQAVELPQGQHSGGEQEVSDCYVCACIICDMVYCILILVFGQTKPEGQSVASRQQTLTTTYEKLVQAAEVRLDNLGKIIML